MSSINILIVLGIISLVTAVENQCSCDSTARGLDASPDISQLLLLYLLGQKAENDPANPILPALKNYLQPSPPYTTSTRIYTTTVEDVYTTELPIRFRNEVITTTILNTETQVKTVTEVTSFTNGGETVVAPEPVDENVIKEIIEEMKAEIEHQEIIDEEPDPVKQLPINIRQFPKFTVNQPPVPRFGNKFTLRHDRTPDRSRSRSRARPRTTAAPLYPWLASSRNKRETSTPLLDLDKYVSPVSAPQLEGSMVSHIAKKQARKLVSQVSKLICTDAPIKETITITVTKQQ